MYGHITVKPVFIAISILIKHESCGFVHVSEATKSPSFMKFWLKASFGPGWNMTKPDFRNLDFYGFYRHFSCFSKCVF